MEQTIYKITQQHLGREDLGEFLRRAIAKQFEGKEYYICKEEIVERPTSYSTAPRKLRGFLINEANSKGHSIWFDVTDVKQVTWVG